MDRPLLAVGGGCFLLGELGHILEEHTHEHLMPTKFEGAAAMAVYNKLSKPNITRLNAKGEPWDGKDAKGNNAFACPIVIHDGLVPHPCRRCQRLFTVTFLQVYISGQVGWKGKPEPDPEKWSEDVISKSIEGQTARTLEKIDALLKVAGTSKANIIDTQVWVQDIDKHFDAMNVEYKKWAGEGPNKGVRACVESKMARKCLLVEIKVVAALP